MQYIRATIHVTPQFSQTVLWQVCDYVELWSLSYISCYFKGITVRFTTSSIRVLESEGPAEICAIITSGSIASDFDKMLRAATQTLEASDAIQSNMKATGNL